MIVDKLADLPADAAERVVPTHTLKLAADALHGVEESIGCVVQPMLLEPLEARITACRYVAVIGLDVDDLIAIYRDLEAT